MSVQMFLQEPLYVQLCKQKGFSASHCTVKPRVCVLVIPPPAAVTVRVDVPTATVDAAFSVSVLLPPPATVAGAKLAVIPLGSPLTDSAILELNPLLAAVATLTAIDPPRATVTFVPPRVRVKLGTVTVRLNARVLVTPPPLPVTVRE